MAQEKEDFSNKNSPNNNSEDEDDGLVNGNNSVKPDLGFENVNYPHNAPEYDGNRSEKKTSNQIRKEESAFSFKHFLKRDLSLPSTSASYESTGAKPKIYSNSVHPSLAKLNLHQESRKDAKIRDNRPNNASSDSSIELHLNSESRNLSDSDGAPSFRRAHTSSDALGMPSLPDFVQDHLLVEQAYLGSDAPLNVDFDNLPDFTFNSNNSFNSGNSPAWGGSKVREVYDGWEAGGGGSGREQHSGLALDLTDCVERPQPAPHLFPLDLPPNATGGESLRLPDFLPTQAGEGPGQAGSQTEGERDEVAQERRLRTAAQRDLRASQQQAAALRRELKAARAFEQRARRELTERDEQPSHSFTEANSMGRPHGDESFEAALKSEIEKLKEELRVTRSELDELRCNRRAVARSLVHATNSAEASLRDLLSGLEQVRGLASSLDLP